MLRNKSFQNQLIQTARVLNEVLSLNAQECLVIVKAGRQTQSSMKS